MSRPRISRRDAGGLVRVRGELDPACLSAAAGQHLRLHDDGPAELGRGLARLLRGGRQRGLPRRGCRTPRGAPCPGARRGPRPARLPSRRSAALQAYPQHRAVRRPAHASADRVRTDRGRPVHRRLLQPRLLGHGRLLPRDVDRLVRRARREAVGADDVVRLPSRPGRRQGARPRDARGAARRGRVSCVDGGGDRRPRAARQRPAAGRAPARRRDRGARPREAQDVVAGGCCRGGRAGRRRGVEHERLVVAAPARRRSSPGSPASTMRARRRASSAAPAPCPPEEGDVPPSATLAPCRRVDRSTIWPYDTAGEPRDFYYSRYGHPTGAEAEARLGELEGGHALLFASGMAAETAVVLAFARPGTTIALAEGRLLRDLGALPLARGLGAQLRRVRPDGPAARGCRHRLGRGAREPGADRARLGRGPRPRRASSSATRPSRRRSTCARSTRAPTSSCTRGRSSSPEVTTRSAAQPSSAIPAVPRALRGGANAHRLGLLSALGRVDDCGDRLAAQAHAAHHGDLDRARAAPRRRTRGRASPLPRLLGTDLVRRAPTHARSRRAPA